VNVSRYQVLQILGQSRCSCTCRALDLSQTPPRACVIKQVKLDQNLLNSSEKHPKQIIQTVHQRLKAIQHPQLPTWIDAFADPLADPAGDCCLYWVQDYIEGESLATRLEQNPFGATEIWEILASVLPILQALHQQQVIHGDIKPENLICSAESERLSNRLNLVLVDYALPNLIPESTGSPEYAAPEQVRGRATFASDLYSLGLTCLHLLTGMRPMALAGLNHWSAVCQADLPNGLVQFLNGLTAPNLAQRYASAAAAIAALERFRGQKLKLPQPELPRWNCCATLTGHEGLFASVNAVAVSPDGNWLASASDDKTVRLWRNASGSGSYQLLGHGGFVKAVAFHPTEPILASGSQDRTIRIWNYQTGKALQTLTGHSHQINALAYSPDGVLASGSSDKTIRLWQDDRVVTLTGHRLAVNGLAFGRDEQGQLVLVSGSSDGTVRLWDLASQTCRPLTGHRLAVRAVAASQTQIASGGEDRVIHVWDWSGALIQTLPGHSWTVTGLAFAPDGKTLVSASWDKTLKLWQVETGAELAVLKGHSDSVCAVCISPDGQSLVSASQDKTLRVWQSNPI
jgi:WD40 repeat protein